MDERRLLNYTQYILAGLFCAGIFVFFAFFYNHHLHFAEQIQLFLLTGDYFISKMSIQGGFSGYLGEFLTQFYYLPFTGPLILTLLILAVQQLVWRIIRRVRPDTLFFPLSFIPALWCAMIMCNEFYPLSAVTGYIIGLMAGWFFISIRNGSHRFYSGLLLLPAVYWLAGGAYLMLFSIIIVFEITVRQKTEDGRRKTEDGRQKTEDGRQKTEDGRSERSGDSAQAEQKTEDGRKKEGGERQITTLQDWILRSGYFILLPIIAVVIPFIVKHYIVMQPLMPAVMSEYYHNILTVLPVPVVALFSMPAMLMLAVRLIRINEKLTRHALVIQTAGLLLFTWIGFRIWADFSAEAIMKYDYLVRNERWSDVIKLADNKPPRNWLSLAMLNLSLAKTGQLGNKMFTYDQRGVSGLFLPFAREYVAPMMGNEIFYHLSLTNASQHYSFESMETIPNHNKSVRMIKRLAETNLINGNYGTSEKYLKLLEKTIFYSKWAKETRTYLYDDNRIAAHPVYGEKRKFAVRNDYFFHVLNMEAVLHRMIRENPDNRMAFEYLMAFYLINKDLRNFSGLVPQLEKMNYREIPISYQEAMLYIIGLTTTDPFSAAPSYINANVRNRMKAFADIYTKYPEPEERLRRHYPDTYWYFLHFGETEGRQLGDRTN